MLSATVRRHVPILGAKVQSMELAAAVSTAKPISHYLAHNFPRSVRLHGRRPFGTLLLRHSQGSSHLVRRTSTKHCKEAEASGSDSNSTIKGGSYNPLPLAYISYERRDSAADPSAQPKTPLIVQHALFGRKENWKKIGKEVNFISKRTVFALDARNHGESPHSNEMSLALIAKDILHFTKQQQLTQISFMGHSFGGRIGMMVAMMYPHLLNRLVVVDSTPLTIQDSILRYSLILKATSVLKNMEPELRQCNGYSRMSAASKAIEPILKDKQYIAAILSNLILSCEQPSPTRGKEEDGVKVDPNSLWNVNLDSILSNPYLMDFPDFDESVAFDGPTLFIQGKKSQCISREDEPKIKRLFPNAEFAWLDDCGHWIHLEKRAEFLQNVVQFLGKKATT